jgi:hypothetical protein
VPNCATLIAQHPGPKGLEPISDEYRLGTRMLYGPAGGKALFTFNETNGPRVFGPGAVSRRHYVKDAFHRHVVEGEDCVNPEAVGTRAALHYFFEVPAGGSVVLRLRFADGKVLYSPLDDVDEVIERRKSEADEYYNSIHARSASKELRHIQRRAFAGLLWTKMSYLYDVNVWLDGDNPDSPPPAPRRKGRNQHWRHLNSLRVMIPAEKWEYPWFAAWDLAFTCPALCLVDPELAKEQLWLLLFEQFQHPNGQVPAYEWEFSDLNPPVHAWSVWRVYNMDRIRTGRADRAFLEKCFHKLMMNFAWWVNRVDREDNNIFEGGFLGMDNISVVDRSLRCADGSVLQQSDGSGYMGMFCLNMMRIALELAKENPVYEGLAVKFLEHYVFIAGAMKHMGARDYALWDEEDGFFYDVLLYPNGSYRKFRLRSLVGLIPLFAVERLEEDWIRPFTKFTATFHWLLRYRPKQLSGVVHKVEEGDRTNYALTVLDGQQLTRLMQRLFDPDEFLSDYGPRSLSKAHQQRPFEFDGQAVGYEAAESGNKIKGGNSNWRGPIWFPTSFLLIESLRKLGKAFGPRFTVRTPASNHEPLTFNDMACLLAKRMIRIFLPDERGRRPVWGGSDRFQHDEHWKDHLLFYEYFHGDNGAGLGASHQTGWTGCVAKLIELFGLVDGERALRAGKQAAFTAAK